MKLSEELIGKLVSLVYDRKIYPEVLVIKEDGRVRLLNNYQRNNDMHKDKSIYKYSLVFSNWDEANYSCSNIKLLNILSQVEIY